MTRRWWMAGLGVLVAFVALWSFARRSPAAESEVLVEPNGRWHVDGETFWFGAPGDIFLTGPALGFAGGEGASDYAIWRGGVVHFAGKLAGGVRETVSVVAIGLPTDIPVVVSYHHGSPSDVAYIRDGIVYDRNGDEVTGWFNPEVPGLPGVRLAPRPPLLVPSGKLRENLAASQGHPLIGWPLRLDGDYSCATEGPGDILVPPHTILEEGSQVTLCPGNRFLVEGSTLRGFDVHGPIVLRDASDLERMHLRHGGLVVESGIGRVFDFTRINGVLQVEPGAELRLDQSDVTVGGHGPDYPVGIIVRSTEPVVLLDSFIGIRHYLEPASLATIEVPDGYGPADVTLIDSRTAPLDFPVTCLDIHETYCTED